ncbi:GNAT family N-acetyltransferase [Enterococcus rivorum]|uniref:N-acetyltransferase domain-containing protein n=1 Tax=Enterococcus rivorum TaxID=762845 RepID=A0A1E5KVB7_9ENTE|nr:GNAT family N-acetyltransferase [Enterococcus rivorum]MBP2100340.1 putative acetyltransferase [Enterococcus rivorum]OEH81748.1 hypothetical protein BCR26_15655 [Enterococcus rivorum]
MIKKVTTEDEMGRISEIWLESNIETHDFIAADYWKSHLAEVKQLMIEAEIYAVYEEEQPVAFIGLVGNYIAGIFILKDYQKKGYGKKLLKVAQQKYSELHLSVYEKNQNAVAFYKYQNFIIIEQKMDENNEVEYLMVWTK